MIAFLTCGKSAGNNNNGYSERWCQSSLWNNDNYCHRNMIQYGVHEWVETLLSRQPGVYDVGFCLSSTVTCSDVEDETNQNVQDSRIIWARETLIEMRINYWKKNWKKCRYCGQIWLQTLGLNVRCFCWPQNYWCEYFKIHEAVSNVMLVNAAVLLDWHIHMLRNASRRKICFSYFLIWGQRQNLIYT